MGGAQIRHVEQMSEARWAVSQRIPTTDILALWPLFRFVAQPIPPLWAGHPSGRCSGMWIRRWTGYRQRFYLCFGCPHRGQMPRKHAASCSAPTTATPACDKISVARIWLRDGIFYRNRSGGGHTRKWGVSLVLGASPSCPNERFALKNTVFR